jgi:hypothetical protein
VNVIGCPPAQEPLFAVTVWLCCATPEIVGGLAFTGLPAVVDPLTTGVAFEFALPLPSTFDAITRERILRPTSARLRM